jgi:type VI secretion system protein ImpA
MTGSGVLDLDRLLAPIRGSSPAGSDLRYDALYDRVRALRRAGEEERLGQGTGGGTADATRWRTVLSLTSDAVATQSKDLQLVVWLTEAATRVAAFAGLHDGLLLTRGLLETFWESLYPLIEPEDEEPLAFRAGVLQWLNGSGRSMLQSQSTLPDLVRMLPLTDATPQYALVHYEASQADKGKRDALAALGWPNADAFHAVLRAGSPAFVEATLQAVTACQAAVAELERVCDDRLVQRRRTATGGERIDPLVSFTGLKHILETCSSVVAASRPDGSADAVAPPSGAVPQSSNPVSVPTSEARAPEPPRSAPPVAATASKDAVLADRGAALAQLDAVIRFLLQDNAYHPLPYLLSRSLAVGQLLAYETLAEAQTLPAPENGARQRLRQLAADQDWVTLRDESERALRGEKRVWLDLHRYADTALVKLGPTYARAAASARAMTALLLHAYPDLLDAELEDGTPAASAETRRWAEDTLRSHGGPAPARVAPVPSQTVQVEPTARTGDDDALEEGRQLLTAGHSEAGLGLLQEYVRRAESGRERFLRRLALTECLVERGYYPLAAPIAEDLASLVDTMQLDSWETTDVALRAWTAALACARADSEGPGAAGRVRELFGRICRLDPARAVMLASPEGTLGRR